MPRSGRSILELLILRNSIKLDKIAVDRNGKDLTHISRQRPNLEAAQNGESSGRTGAVCESTDHCQAISYLAVSLQRRDDSNQPVVNCNPINTKFDSTDSVQFCLVPSSPSHKLAESTIISQERGVRLHNQSSTQLIPKSSISQH